MENRGEDYYASEHRIAYLWEMCDRTIIINDGRIIRNLDKEEMKKITEEEVRDFGIRSFVERNPFKLDIDEAADSDNILSNFKNYK